MADSAEEIIRGRVESSDDSLKSCNSCNDLVPKDQYKKDRRRPDGLGSVCNECSAYHSKRRRSMKMSPERALEVSLRELYRISPPLTTRERHQWDVVNLSLKRLVTKEQ